MINKIIKIKTQNYCYYYNREKKLVSRYLLQIYIKKEKRKNKTSPRRNKTNKPTRIQQIIIDQNENK